MKARVWEKVKKIAAAVFLSSFFLLPDAQAANSDIIRLGVVKFDSKAQGVRDDQAEIISDLFGRTLTNSRRIALIERDRIDEIGKEQRLNMSGLVAPELAVQVGYIAGCQYMLMGSVTELKKGRSTTVFPIPIQLPIPIFGGGRPGIGNTQEVAKVTIDVRIVDVTTSEVVGAFAETGVATNSSSAVSIGGFRHVESSFGGIESRAIADAVNRLAHRIRSDIAEEYSYVVSAESPSRINIDVGSNLGVQPGTLYLVYLEGAVVRGIDGSIIGRKKEPIAAVVVDDTEPGYSTCEATKDTNGKLIQREDRIEPISAEEYRKMVKDKKFPKERPKKLAYDDTLQPPADNSPEPAEPIFSESSRAFENVSTDPKKVIPTYGLSAGAANLMQIAHNGAKRLTGKRAYNKYVELANAYSSDYLAAYQAGRFAPNKSDARTWYDRALTINPNYEPAQKARDRLK